MIDDALERLREICLGLPGATERLSHGEPTWFVRDRKTFVGTRGWIGVRLDVDPDWDEIERIVESAYRVVAPLRLVRELGATRRPR